MGLGSGQYRFIISDLTDTSSGLTLLFIKSNVLHFGEVAEAHKADVMAIINVNSTGITQAHD